MSERLGLVDAFRTLNPTAREYTYVPNAAMNINRSRIDFFMISERLAVQKFKAAISSGLISKSFDHKKISLEFGIKTPKNFNKINDALINTVEMEVVVRTTVYESYLVHTDGNAFPGFRKNELLIEIGRINNNLRNYFSLKMAGGNEIETNRLLDEILAILETLPDPEFFFNLPLECEDDFFFEGLIMAIKTNTLSLQKK
jgi:hypothetical protein